MLGSEFEDLFLVARASAAGFVRSFICLQTFDGLQGLTKLRYLNLSHNSLSGALQDTAFRTLKNLQILRLRSNKLNGSIPASLFELPHLEYLDLSNNLLQGHIPISSSSNLSSTFRIELSSNNLNGTLDFFWLQNCTMLKMIDLSRNAYFAVDMKFHGTVPPLQLKVLKLSGCKLDKSIITRQSFLDTQHHLQILDLSSNNLAGSLPNWMFTDEVSLVYLDLSNNLLEGTLDLMWQHQSNLEMINISMNHFVGQLPTNMSSVFPNLTVLDASYNNISGNLPLSLCHLSHLENMDLSNNKFMGDVPICMFASKLLRTLKLSNNNLGGPILGGASNLSIEEIHLASNNFIGEIPNNLSGHVITMNLGDNMVSGKLDASSWNLSSLKVLNVAGNRLTGEIHPAICNLTGLQFLDMSNNNFVGSIPNCSSKLNLSFLNMSSNNFTGFSNGFFNSSQLIALDLRYNQFKGSLIWIQYLSQIKMLLLGWNKFEGDISPNLCHLQYLNILDFSHNKLSGSLPPCIGRISFGYHSDSLNLLLSRIWGDGYGLGFSDMDDGYPSFVYDAYYDLQSFTFPTKGNLYTYGRSFFNLMFGIDFSANMLSGEIPWEIGNLSHVKSLNLSHNFFTGQIPATFANISAIESLDLSYNHLSGPIPSQLTQLWSLEVFSVAYNNLSGCIPNSDQFLSFGAECYTGNTNLHNLSHGNQCSPPLGPVDEGDMREEETSADPILYVTSAASFVLAFWATVAFVFCHPYGQRVILQL